MNDALALQPDDDGKQPALPALLPPDELAAEVFFDKLERTTGDYTASRLRSKRPDDYKLIITMLANGWGSQKIQDEFHHAGKQLSKNTVKAVRAIEGETVDRLRERLAAESFLAADDYREAAVTILNEIMSNKFRREKLTIRDVQSLEVASGIATQNGQLLSGLPTARVSIEDLRQPDHEDFNRQLATLPKAIDLPATHLIGKPAGQKEAAPPGTTPSSTPTTTPTPAAPDPAAAPDSQSDGSMENTQ